MARPRHFDTPTFYASCLYCQFRRIFPVSSYEPVTMYAAESSRLTTMKFKCQQHGAEHMFKPILHNRRGNVQDNVTQRHGCVMGLLF